MYQSVSLLSVCLSVCLCQLTCLCVCLPIHLSVSIVCDCLFVSSVCLFSIYQSYVCHLSVWFSLSPFSVFLPCQSLNCLSTKVLLSVCFCISLSVYLFNCQFVLSIYFTMSLVPVSFWFFLVSCCF